MKYFLIRTSLFLLANWLQQGVASGEGSEVKRIDKPADTFDKEIQDTLIASLQGAVGNVLKKPDDNIFNSRYYFKGPQQIKKSAEGTFAASILKPPTDYVLKFGIEPKGTLSGWNSIIHFTNINENSGAYGGRVPGIWFYSDTTRLHVEIGSTTNGQHSPDLSEPLAINNKSIVEVRVVGSLATVLINGVIKSTMSIGSRTQLDKVKVYIGAPWFPAANAIISDISFNKAFYYFNGTQQIKRSTVSTFAASILKPPTDYVLKFGIEPKGTVSGFGSIIHLTNNNDCCAYGARVPDICFWPGTTRLLVSTGTTTNGIDYQSLHEHLAINKKSIVEVRVFGSLATVLINGVIKSTMSISSRTQLDEVKLYIGDPWYPAANAIISDISFTSSHVN